MTRKRSEYGKAIRKDYEKGKVDASWNEIKEYDMRKDGLSNTLSTVLKDNLVVEMEESIEWPDGADGTTTAKEGDAVKIQPRPDREFSRGNVRTDMTNALNTKEGCGSGVVVRDNKGRTKEIENGQIVGMATPGCSIKDQNGSRYNEDESFAVTTGNPNGVASNEEGRLRIRYLTPRECLRLQAFPDEEIDKLEKVLSKSALYKVAGNSIAVCCLKAIFKGIYIDKTFKSDRQITLDRFF